MNTEISSYCTLGYTGIMQFQREKLQTSELERRQLKGLPSEKIRCCSEQQILRSFAYPSAHRVFTDFTLGKESTLECCETKISIWDRSAFFSNPKSKGREGRVNGQRGVFRSCFNLEEYQQF